MRRSSLTVTTRTWSDWIGFVFYAIAATMLLIQSPALALWLLPTFLHEAVIAVAFLIRPPARRTLTGIAPRLAAYTGSLGLLVFMQASRLWWPEWMTPTASENLRAAGAWLWLAGSVFGLWAVWYLRQSFSLEPAARELVTSGPYRFARHPIYTGYVLQYGGMGLVFPSVPFALALIVWFMVLLARIRYEERVLSAAFDEYVGYRAQVGALAPRLGWTLSRREAAA